ncbi:MAG: dihydroorotate dehydrogenase [Limnochordales bacterium]|nr:dihydroorotate dehydrogenase [Limnochordales bacterium]
MVRYLRRRRSISLASPVDLSVDLGRGLILANPVMTASGTCGYGEELARFIDLRQLGAFVVKGTTLHPRVGNPPPRLVETPAGVLNSIGLQNPGIDRVIAEKIPFLARLGVPVIVNIAGDTPAEYGELAARLDKVSGVAGIELNISCPNVEKGGMLFGADPQLAAEVVATVRQVTRLPVIVKLSPNVTDIGIMARAVVQAGADAVSLVNTYTGMVIDVERRRPVLARGVGGLSGPAIRPLAVYQVWQAYRALSDTDREGGGGGERSKVPIIGMGGITSARDALEFILAGASAVAVGTATFVRPVTVLEVVSGIREYCQRHGIRSLRQLVGAAHREGLA